MRQDDALRFDHFELRPAERVLLVDGRSAVLGARAFDLLLALAERRERLVTKQELLDLVWPGVVVEEGNIATQISTLRKLLGAQVIATVPGRGYRFTARPADAAAHSAAPTAPTSPGAAATNLPRQLTPLLGRDADLDALAAQLTRYRLVTIVGAGGIGKTLLAQHVVAACAGEYAHGVCWVELASVGDAVALPQRIADALGVRMAGGEPLASLCAAVSPLALLLALDNAEHLLADVARIANALLDAVPRLKLLVTSQAPLRLAAECVYRVGPLAVPEGVLPAAMAQSFAAVALFALRAQSADARFVLSDGEAPAAIELCRQLDGLPLAIELAAARAPLLGVRRLAASMQDRMLVLTRNRDAAAPARQQTLRAALEWSCSFLAERERIVFRRLAVTAGSASLTLIQRVVADDDGALDGWAVLDALGILVDRSLVAVTSDHDEASGEPRYRLLDSPRALALEQLRAADEEAALRQRHAAALAAAFDAAWEARWSGRVGAQDWAQRLRPDADDARAAIAWARAAGEPAWVVAIAATLFHVLPRSSQPERTVLGDLCESLAEQAAKPALPAPLRLRAWTVAVRPILHPHQQRSLAVAGKAVELARELHREAADPWPLYRALAEWISAASLVARPAGEAVRSACAEMSALEEPRWPAARLVVGAGARRFANLVVPYAGDQPVEQLRLTRQQIALLEAEGQDTAPIMGTLIDAELECDHFDAAVQLGEQMLERLAGTRDEYSRLMVRLNLAQAYLLLGDAGRARPLVQAAWPVALQYKLQALASIAPALLAAIEGRARAAALLVGYVDAAYAARDLFRHPIEVACRERAHGLARKALGDEKFDRLYVDGRQLRDEQIAALAFAHQDLP